MQVMHIGFNLEAERLEFNLNFTKTRKKQRKTKTSPKKRPPTLQKLLSILGKNSTGPFLIFLSEDSSRSFLR